MSSRSSRSKAATPRERSKSPVSSRRKHLNDDDGGGVGDDDDGVIVLKQRGDAPPSADHRIRNRRATPANKSSKKVSVDNHDDDDDTEGQYDLQQAASSNQQQQQHQQQQQQQQQQHQQFRLPHRTCADADKHLDSLPSRRLLAAEVMVRNKLAPCCYSTPRGRRLYYAQWMASLPFRTLGYPTVDVALLQRSMIIDHLVKQRIERGEIQQIIEINCGISHRGGRLHEFAMCKSKPITYIETDAPEAAEAKRLLMEKNSIMVSRGKSHFVIGVDPCDDQADLFLADQHILKLLCPSKGTAIIAEGFLNHVEPHKAKSFLHRIACLLADKSISKCGVLFADVKIDLAPSSDPIGFAADALISHFEEDALLQYSGEEDLKSKLSAEGFKGEVTVHVPAVIGRKIDCFPRQAVESRGRIVEAWVA